MTLIINIVDGVISLAKAFNRQGIAEGGENIVQGKMLLLLSCESAQGHHIVRPMSADQLSSWLARYHPEQIRQDFAKTQISAQQHALQLFMLMTQRWLEQLIHFRQVHLDLKDEPMMNFESCQCDNWLGQVKQLLFDGDYLSRLSAKHKQLHEAGQQFIHADITRMAALSMGIHPQFSEIIENDVTFERRLDD